MNSGFRRFGELLGDEFRFQKLSGASDIRIEVSAAPGNFGETNSGFRSPRRLLRDEFVFQKLSGTRSRGLGSFRSSRELLGDEFWFQKPSGASGTRLQVSEDLGSTARCDLII